MQFPDSKLPPVFSATNPTEITPKTPISPARKVVPGFQETLAESGGQPQGRHEAESATESPQQNAPPYTGPDRRMMCRRICNIPVILDTRSGEERRKNDEPGEFRSIHMDRTV
jgi:hypothetical protein